MTEAAVHDADVRWRGIVCVNDCAIDVRLAGRLDAAGYDVTTVDTLVTGCPMLAPDEPAVVIIDDSHHDWLRWIADLASDRPLARVVVLMSHDNPDEFLAALSAGAAGFCTAHGDIDALVRTVESVRQSGVAIPRWMVAPLVERMRYGRGHRVQSAAGPINVTDREWEILQLMLQRRSTKEMSSALFVSVGTVRSHVSALVRKLGAVDREDAVALIERAQRR